jgi:putative oxidoreductase
MSRLIDLAGKALSLVKKTDWVALLVARLTVGLEFVSTGWGKVHNLDKVTAFFANDLHIPMPRFNAVFASYTELLCGTALTLGIASRLSAVPLIVTMLVALLTAKAHEIMGVTDLVGELEWAYVAILVIIVSLGPGAVSIDGVLSRLKPPTRAPKRALA